MIEVATLALVAAIALLARNTPLSFAPAIVGWDDAPEDPPEEPKAWERMLMFKKGSSKAPAPDKNIGIAALKEAQTGEDWLEFSKQQFEVGNARQDKMDALTNQVTTAQLQSMTDANARATEQWNRYKNTFEPLQDEYIAEARNWGSADRQNQMAAEARQDVMNNAAAAAQQNQRQMASMGVSPTSGRYAGVDRATDLNTALAAAGAQNTARNQVRTQALALKEGLANMGQGATSTSAQQVGLGLNSGNSAVGNTSTANQNWMANNQIMNQGFSGAMQGYQGQAGILSNLYGQQLSGWQAQQQQAGANASGLMQGLGTVATVGAVVF